MGIINDGQNSGFYMPVAPAYGGGYGNGGGFFGGDWAWIILLLLIGGGGWGFGGTGGMMWPMMMGGMGGFGIDYLYPWLNNSQHMSDGFRDQALQTSIGSLQNSVTAGFGDVQLGIAGANQNICQTGNAISGAVRDGFNAAEIAANGRAMAAMQQGYGTQSIMQQGFSDNRSASYQNTRDIIDAIRSGDQGIMDKLCQLELDNVKAQYAQAQRENVTLQNQLNMAAFRESQANQNALFQQGLNNEVDALYNRLKNCPVGTTPVYGNQPIFTCPQTYNGCGCGAA